MRNKKIIKWKEKWSVERLPAHEVYNVFHPLQNFRKPGFVALALLVALASATYFGFGGANIKRSHRDATDTHLFTVVDIPGKGKGVVAARDIQVCM
jgi:hypothetical protein